MQTKSQFIFGVTLLSLTFAVFAQKPIVYPSKGQSAAQQNKDDGECYVWAKQNTGYDPASPPVQASQPAAPLRQGGVLRGAAAGAVVGGVGGNDVGNAAAKGAVIGGVAQRARHRNQQDAANQQTQAAQQQQAAANDTYQRAYSACMSGRGYTVN